MPFSAVIFSAEALRGALISKTLEKNGYRVYLYNKVHSAGDILEAKAPQIVIIDKEGYFPGELESFSLLSGILKGIPLVIVSNSEADDSIHIKDISVHWCRSNPLDPLAIVATANSILEASGSLPAASDRIEPSGKEAIAQDLMGFLGME
jgi:DNA-binding response OmpR family regulator